VGAFVRRGNGHRRWAPHAIIDSSIYDSSRRVTVEGVVTQFQLVNPHLPDHRREGWHRPARQWRLEMDNRSELAAIGVVADTFVPGDRVVVTGSLARTQGESMYLLRLDRPADGFWYEQSARAEDSYAASPPALELVDRVVPGC
jgi:hypothetical protein